MSDGQVLAERYRLIEQLSRGGMGSVWRAEHVELGTPAAVKLIDPTLADTEEALIRFRREAQAAASLRSTNIVQIFDYGVAGGIPFIAMELLRGQSLARRLALAAPLSPLETAVILMQVGKAVAWAHSMGVVHRDLKPDNVFLAEDAGETVVKLLDFGIAKTFALGRSEPQTTVTGAIMGTPYYMSPEQAVGDRAVDFRSDIWSYAIIAFECLTGQRPFNAETVGGLVLAICSGKMPKPTDTGEVPLGFDEWFARAANRDPNRRFPSIREAAVELRRVCAGDLDDEALGLSASGKRILSSGNEPQSPALSTSTIANSNSSTALSTAGVLSTITRLDGNRSRALVLGLGLIAAAVTVTLVLRRTHEPEPSRSAPSEPSSVAYPSAPETSADPAAAPAEEAAQLGQRAPVDTGKQEPAVEPPSPSASAAAVGPMGKPTRKTSTLSTRARELPSASSSSATGATTTPSAKASGPDLDRMVGF